MCFWYLYSSVNYDNWYYLIIQSTIYFTNLKFEKNYWSIILFAPRWQIWKSTTLLNTRNWLIWQMLFICGYTNGNVFGLVLFYRLSLFFKFLKLSHTLRWIELEKNKILLDTRSTIYILSIKVIFWTYLCFCMYLLSIIHF